MQSLKSVKRGNSSTRFASHFQSLQQMEKVKIKKKIFFSICIMVMHHCSLNVLLSYTQMVKVKQAEEI